MSEASKDITSGFLRSTDGLLWSAGSVCHDQVSALRDPGVW